MLSDPLFSSLFPPSVLSATYSLLSLSLCREAFNVSDEDNKKILDEIKDNILRLTQNFGANITVKGIGTHLAFPCTASKRALPSARTQSKQNVLMKILLDH